MTPARRQAQDGAYRRLYACPESSGPLRRFGLMVIVVDSSARPCLHRAAERPPPREPRGAAAAWPELPEAVRAGNLAMVRLRPVVEADRWPGLRASGWNTFPRAISTRNAICSRPVLIIAGGTTESRQEGSPVNRRVEPVSARPEGACPAAGCVLPIKLRRSP
jgi:hypothetical protein